MILYEKANPLLSTSVFPTCLFVIYRSILNGSMHRDENRGSEQEQAVGTSVREREK